MDLITMNLENKILQEGPLARRMRPEKIEEFAGQEHILGPGKPLRAILEGGRFVSLLLHGPPGTGKTTLAGIIAKSGSADFVQLNAVSAGVKDVRSIIDQARENWSLENRRTILFIDEIHRFSKAQQDVLLSAVEQGTIIFIGATTENPFFYLTGPLLSRLRLFVFEPLREADILTLLQKALQDREKGLGELGAEVEAEALGFIASKSDGDARAALNTLELALLIGAKEDGKTRVTLQTAAEALQKKLLAYDRKGDNHYDIASAFIKSIRGSDPDAALYWMARMLQGGEDPMFIARRLIISASEDIGNAEPQALQVAVAAAQAVQMIGLPEGRITLAQAVTYLASAPKSNASYLAINEAVKVVEAEAGQGVPKHLRDSSYGSAKKLGHGAGYRYPHNYPNGYVEQEYLPAGIKEKIFYNPTEYGREAEISERLKALRKTKGNGKEKR